MVLYISSVFDFVVNTSDIVAAGVDLLQGYMFSSSSVAINNNKK